MENPCASVTAPAPLFITEDDEPSEAGGGNVRLRSPAQSDHSLMGVSLCQTLSIGPYLKEMDDLLKNCEELTGISENTWNETRVCSQEYMSTSCVDTEDVQLLDAGFDPCGAGTCASSAMPLTSAGNKLSESMSEYEEQLMDMLSMLESCEEDSTMDHRPQDWSSTDEYVHIPKLFKETGKTPLESGKSVILETHAAASNFCDHQDGNNEVYSRKRAARTQTDNVYHSDNARGLSGQSSEECNEDHNAESALNPSVLTQQLTCKGTHTEEDCEVKAAGNSDLNEADVDMAGLSTGLSELQSLGPKLDEFIDEVQRLVQKRRELQTEVMKLCGNSRDEQTAETPEEDTDRGDKVAELISRLKEAEQLQREKSMSEIENLRHERAEEERKLWRVGVERQSLHGEHWRLKKKLYVVTKECAQSQAALRAQQQHVDLLKKEEEKLQTAEVELREESNKQRLEHQQKLLNLQQKLDLVTSSHRSNTQELSQSRRDSCGDIQQYVQDTLKALEEWYGPVLEALLKRRDSAVNALTKVKDQTQELRVQLTPLREEMQKLTLQNVCLEEKLRLMSFQRKEETGQYKETVNSLEETCRQLKMELRIQNTKTNEMKELKDRLNQQLAVYRSATGDHDCDEQRNTDP
ncbi:hypothetical protein NQD34_008302 [Periophthalmus magnuspinnatus]|nr:hypothetical protein NQD34_008302 [Periophthalmus magnuspinnatus]